MKYISEGLLKFEEEDGGMALIGELWENQDDDSEGMFFRVQSWSDFCNHQTARKFEGKRVRITMEVID